MNVIITGATGMVGEGVLLECLENPVVTKVLVVGRRHYDLSHPKLTELIVPDFQNAGEHAARLTGYDACFYCAGVSSIGMKEADYARITYDTTIAFAKILLQQNPDMVFDFVTGKHTDSTGQGKMMWARIKGKTENDLMKLGFRGQYNFRPGLMTPTKGQKSMKALYKVLAFILKPFMRRSTLTLKQVGRAMINTVIKGYKKQVLEVEDIKELAL